MRIKTVARGSALVMMLALLASAGTSPEVVGRATAVRKPATIAAPPAAALAARAGSSVALGNVVATGPAGAMQVQLADSTYFSIGANSSLTIDKFVYDPNHNASQMLLSIARGAFRFVSGKATHAYPGQPAISTPAAAIGIRGTIVSGVVGPDAVAVYDKGEMGTLVGNGDDATLIVLEDGGGRDGGIDIMPRGSDRIIALRTPGQAIFFPRVGGEPSAPFVLSNAQERALRERAAPGPIGRDPSTRGQTAARNGIGRDRGGAGPEGTAPNSQPPLDGGAGRLQGAPPPPPRQ